MTPTAKARFDRDYQIVRAMLVQGRLTLAEARLWVKGRGDMTAILMQEDLDKLVKAQLKHRAGWEDKGLMEEDNDE